MSARVRLLVFALAALALLPAVGWVSWHMPEFGAHPLPYGDAINAAGPPQRHVSNMVTAVNFDFRGFDTLGEEFMLLCAVTGAVVLLRGARGEKLGAAPDKLRGRRWERRADSTVLTARLLAPLLLVYGLYVALHAAVTPGGGFQGGVIAASGLLLLWLGDGYRTWRHVVRSRWIDVLEGGGATLFALCALGPTLSGGAVLQNTLPLGQLKDMLSGGLMFVINLGVTAAVGGGFLMLFLEFLEETRAAEKEGE